MLWVQRELGGTLSPGPDGERVLDTAQQSPLGGRLPSYALFFIPLFSCRDRIHQNQSCWLIRGPAVYKAGERCRTARHRACSQDA